MRRNFWLTATAIALLAPGLADAQMQDKMARPGQGDGQDRPPRPGGPGNGGPAIQPPRPARPGNGGPAVQPPRPTRPGNGGPAIQPPRPGPVAPVRPPRPRPPHNGGGFHRPPHYRPPVYRYPHGYHYRRWHVGAVLPTVLFGSAYYFNDYHLFGLYAPPHLYRWVRYGPDLVLVNTRNGHIRDVRYGVFR